MIVLLKANRTHFLKQAAIREKNDLNLEMERTITPTTVIIKPGLYSSYLSTFSLS